MKRNFILLLLLTLCFGSFAQNFSYKWQRVPMDTTLEGNGSSEVEKIIMKYQPGMEALMEIVAYSDGELAKGNPESSLSNLAADVILWRGKKLVGNGDNMLSLTNFGGIRSELPKGAIRIYDIYSVFPFDNKIVVADIQGSQLRKILNRFASSGNFQALGGVKIEVKNHKMTKCEIAGKPLNDSVLYKLVTIDFLLDSGDSMSIGKSSKHVEYHDVIIRDAVVEYLREATSRGIVIKDQKDGRIIIK